MTPPPARLYRGRVADQIVEDLRGQILSGQLPDGSRLPAERELAAHYDVSAPTIREAVRVLTAMGLLSTRNGSRTTVTASGDTLLALSIASVVQFQNVPASDVFGLLGVLNGYAAEQAVARASDADIARLREAAERAADPTADALTRFFDTLAEISGNPLLVALCRFMTRMQVGLAVELSTGSGHEWGLIPRSLAGARMEIVDAIAGRDATAALELVRDYHSKLVKRIQSSPGAKQRRASDPDLAGVLSSWLSGNVTVGGRPR